MKSLLLRSAAALLCAATTITVQAQAGGAGTLVVGFGSVPSGRRVFGS